MPKKRGSGGAPLEFDIIGPEGAALQFDGQYGRSVRFKDGTEYIIEVINKKRAHYAVAIKIDGQKVTTTPMVIFPKGGRKVTGFTDKKTFSRETNEDGTAGHCQIEKEIRPFVACKSASNGAVNPNLGRIEFFCYPVRWVKNTPRSRRTRNRQQAGRGAGRAGVLMTVGGEPHTVHGSHPGRPSIPIADTRAAPFLVYKITVCERA